MGAIGGLVGLGGGASGTGFSGPQATPLLQTTNNNQLNTAYTGAQTGLTSQQQLLNALQAQNGLANQNAVYNQLQGVANGTGPNPAQAMLNNATGQNNAAQAALMAGQRGSGSNVGLIARQAAQQGAANQQNAIGQGAALQAQQSLGAIGQAGSLATQQAGQQIGQTNTNSAAQQAEQQILQNAAASANTANVQQQANINNANASLAGTQMQGQQGLIGGAITGVGSALSLAKGGKVPRVKMAEGGSPSLNGGFSFQPAQNPAVSQAAAAGPSSNAGKNLSGMNAAGNTIGSAIGQGLSSLFSGSPSTLQDTTPGAIADATNGFATSANNFGTAPGGDVSNFGAGTLQSPTMGNQFSQAPGAPTLAKGGKVPAKVSPGEIYLPPKKAKEVAEGKANPKNVGEKIPGKAKVPGDSTKNDTVNKNLEAGGVVVKRSVALDPDDRKAIDFVKAVMAKSSLRR